MGMRLGVRTMCGVVLIGASGCTLLFGLDGLNGASEARDGGATDGPQAGGDSGAVTGCAAVSACGANEAATPVGDEARALARARRG
jgi:hypothetical protein